MRLMDLTHLASDIDPIFYNLAAFVGAIYLIYKARHLDKENYILQKATPSVTNMVNVFDDVWLRGQVLCERPLNAPHFGLACVNYDYKLEEKRTYTHTDSKGRTTVTTKWVTIRERSNGRDFELADAGGGILIDGKNAKTRYISNKTSVVGKFRHTLDYIGCPGPASAVGSVNESKTRLEARHEVPLFLTVLGRREFFKKAESAEKLYACGGYLLLWVGFAMGFYNLEVKAQFFSELGWIRTYKDPATLWKWAIASGLCVLPFWAVHLYNNLVIYKRRCRNAWAQVDVDLKQRHNLIPQLVTVVKKYMEHEKDALEGITKARSVARSKRLLSTRIHAEQHLEKAVTHFIALAEKYPDIKAGPSEELFKQIQMIEDKIAFAKKVYNETVEEYNTEVSQFPNIIISSSFGYTQLPYYK